MGRTATTIFAPNIDVVGDVAYVLGRQTGDVGYLCGDTDVVVDGVVVDHGGKINKFSFGKPVRFNKFEGLTDTEMASINCGLSKVELTKMLAKSAGMGTSSYTKAECIAQVAEWAYLKPRGYNGGGAGVHEWYRVLDFDGYNHDAIAPDYGWTAVNLEKSVLSELESVDITETAGSQNYNFILSVKRSGNNYAKYYETFSMRFDKGSSGIWAGGGGDTTNMEIPISLIATINSNTEMWRNAVAVWIPNGDGSQAAADTTDGAWYFFICRYTFYNYHAITGKILSWLMPDFASNPYAASRMNALTPANGYKEFTAVPVLIKNISSTYTQQKYMPNVVSDVTKIYCMPSGAGSFIIGCGTPTTPHYWQVIYDTSTTPNSVKIKNIDTASSHTFKYKIIDNGEERVGTVYNLAAGVSQQVAAIPNGHVVTCTIIEQDGEPV